MTDLRTRFTDDMKTAMKSGDSATLATVRLIIAQMKLKDTEGKGKIDDAGILPMLQTMVKQRQESAKIYRDNNRPELAEKEEAEIKVIETYLPKQLSVEETETAVAAIIAELGVTSAKDMGKVMAELKTRYAGQLDMSKVGPIVKSKLAA
ncbi:MAG: GatB/YqeY domain-containing protein [Rhodospirillales bacterium]|nr:GatB/YqeY domain-containing protein [Rhodospirillales bacterium]USO07701.1 MAG: GatB/YqeY domain-containing protein [Rhodospirillales bacterium]